jgi:hypothetical protein
MQGAGLEKIPPFCIPRVICWALYCGKLQFRLHFTGLRSPKYPMNKGRQQYKGWWVSDRTGRGPWKKDLLWRYERFSAEKAVKSREKFVLFCSKHDSPRWPGPCRSITYPSPLVQSLAKGVRDRHLLHQNFPTSSSCYCTTTASRSRFCLEIRELQ